MFRDGNIICINSKGYGGLHDKSFCREEKGSIKKEKLKLQINNLKRILATQEKLIEKYSEDEYMLMTILRANNVNKKRLRDKQKELKNIIHEEQLSNKRLKRKIKKRSNKWIKKEILKIISEALNNNKNFITKEDIAIRLQVKECQVEQVFMELNREGILSQAEHHALHDSNRDPHGFENSYGWASDIYYIRNKKET